MTLRSITILSRRLCRRSHLFQIVVIVAFWLVGEAAVRIIGLPIPGGIFGMLVVVFLLVAKRLSIRTVQHGARWFLGEMLLFFVPAVLAVLDHPEFLGVLGLKIMAVIVVGTFTVMIVTAGFVDVCYLWIADRRDIGCGKGSSVNSPHLSERNDGREA